jgi:hypothetical protein
LYSDQQLYKATDGPGVTNFIGDKATADARCQTYGENTLGLGCDYFTIFCSYGASIDIENFPDVYGFDADTTRIYSALNPAQEMCFYGSLWHYCIPRGDGQVFLAISLQDAGILPADSNFFSASAQMTSDYGGVWSRLQSCTASPTTAPTARSFTTSTGSVQVGNSSIGYATPTPTQSLWLGGQLLTCSSAEAYVLCACILF